jgi:hypothetical protein
MKSETTLPTSEEIELARVMDEPTISGGDILCTGCWDESGDPHADNDIPDGAPVYWTPPSYEYGETDPYCVACVKRRAEDMRWQCEAIEAEMARG